MAFKYRMFEAQINLRLGHTGSVRRLTTENYTIWYVNIVYALQFNSVSIIVTCYCVFLFHCNLIYLIYVKKLSPSLHHWRIRRGDYTKRSNSHRRYFWETKFITQYTIQGRGMWSYAVFLFHCWIRIYVRVLYREMCFFTSKCTYTVALPHIYRLRERAWLYAQPIRNAPTHHSALITRRSSLIGFSRDNIAFSWPVFFEIELKIVIALSY